MEYNFFPPCPFYTLTGWRCPGCGSQRAIHQLLNGNVIAAWHYNPLMVAAIPYVTVGMWFQWKTPKDRWGKYLHRTLYHGRSTYVILIVVLLFWVERNLFYEY